VKGLKGMAQVVEHLPSKHEALISNNSRTKKEREEKVKENGHCQEINWLSID
jgi:hypothetical protein